ncbi:MAG: alpha/beta hydrolase [Saprospiraceae bacterium]|nr:alpha/beta hydrolase [Saprospiraceae bacterium]
MLLNRLKILLPILLLSVLSACNKEEPVIPTEEPLIELDFSTPPFDLQAADARFAEDIPYDEYESTQFDVLLPTSATPTPLVIFIHGGGFTGGDKQFAYSSDYQAAVIELLSDGIAVATINYRLLESNETVGVLKSLNDAKRAVQYLRYIHKELNIDKDKIGLFGSSAGASTSLWIATNDDFKESNHSDPVLQQSTRVQGVALRATQSSLDIENRWLNDVFGDFGSSWDDLLDGFGEEALFRFYGISSWEEYESPAIDQYRKSVDMLSLLSADDPEIWVTNTGGHNNVPQTQSSFNHHPFHAREIKEYADAVGVPNVAKYGKPVLFSDPSNEEFVDFFIRKLGQ